MVLQKQAAAQLSSVKEQRCEASAAGGPGLRLYPGGMVDNSPTFQRWVASSEGLSPEGTAEIVLAPSAVPSGLILSLALIPTLKRWAILACPFGTKLVGPLSFLRIRSILAVLLVLLISPKPCLGYSLLTHEQIVESLDDGGTRTRSPRGFVCVGG